MLVFISICTELYSVNYDWFHSSFFFPLHHSIQLNSIRFNSIRLKRSDLGETEKERLREKESVRGRQVFHPDY